MAQGMQKSTRLSAALFVSVSLIACGGTDILTPPPPTPAENTVWDFCTAANVPTWLAVQDGSGEWTRITPTGTAFRFAINAHGAVAYVAPTPAGAADRIEVKVLYATQSELNTEGAAQCVSTGSKIVRGSVANLGASQAALVSMAGASRSVSALSSTFDLSGVPDGPVDLLALRNNISNGVSTIDRLIIRRGLNVASNATLPVLDFASAEAFAPAEATIAATNLGADQLYVSTSYGRAGTRNASSLSVSDHGASPARYYGVPTVHQQADELHFAVAIAEPTAGSVDNGFRLAGLYFKNPTNQTVVFGSILPAPTVTLLTQSPSLRPRATGALSADYNRFISAEFLQSQATSYRSYVVEASAGYLNNAATYDLAIPDWSTVAGWDSRWNLKTDLVTGWTVTGYGFSGNGLRTSAAVDGAATRIAYRLGTVPR